MQRKAYIALYFPSGIEQILYTDTFWSPEISAKFDRLINMRHKLQKGHYIQAWYSDATQVECMGIIRHVSA